MKNARISFILILVVGFQISCFAQSSWKSPDYQPQPYRKIMVLAKFADEVNKRQLEDLTVKLLNEQGIHSVQAYANIEESDIANEELFLAKADSLELDGLIVYTITSSDTEYKTTPAVNMNVGVPVRLGIFGGFLGTNVPIAGGTTAVTIVKVNVSFYNRSSKSMQWCLPLTGKLKKNADKLTTFFAKSTLKALEKDQIILQQ